MRNLSLSYITNFGNNYANGAIISSQKNIHIHINDCVISNITSNNGIFYSYKQNSNSGTRRLLTGDSTKNEKTSSSYNLPDSTILMENTTIIVLFL